jgi:DedD protein
MKEYKQQDGQRPNLRHRLVGALVIIALAVILVPLVLDFGSDPISFSSRDNIPEKPQGYRIEEVPLIAAGGDISGTAAIPVPPGQASSVPERPGAASSQAGAGKPPAWVVQVGSFSSQDNARVLRDQLRAKGYKAVFIDRDTLAGKPVLRVRIGPELERNRSEQVREQLAREMKLEAVVVSYDWRSAGVE